MESQELADGLTLRRGDVVWARQGRKPYWPAKEQSSILTIILSFTVFNLNYHFIIYSLQS